LSLKPISGPSRIERSSILRRTDWSGRGGRSLNSAWTLISPISSSMAAMVMPLA